MSETAAHGVGLRAAVTTASNCIEVRAVPSATPGRGEVLIAVERVGLCGSDIHLFAGDHPHSNYPLIQGHEFSGVIAEIGPDVEGSLALGDPVAESGSRRAGRVTPVA